MVEDEEGLSERESEKEEKEGPRGQGRHFVELEERRKESCCPGNLEVVKLKEESSC